MLEDLELGPVLEEVTHGRKSAGHGGLGRALRRDVPPDVRAVPRRRADARGGARSGRARGGRSRRGGSRLPRRVRRHALVLAEAGYRVTGLDRSEVQLAEAERRRGDVDWPKLVRGDYRELPFADESFDAVLNLFTSLGYLERDERRRRAPRVPPRAAAGWRARRRDHASRPARPRLPRPGVGPAARRLALPAGARARLGRRTCLDAPPRHNPGRGADRAAFHSSPVLGDRVGRDARRGGVPSRSAASRTGTARARRRPSCG